MRVNVIEVIVGALVLLVTGLFLMFAYKTSQWHGSGSYVIYANFDRIDGLSIGSDVRVSGVKVGNIAAIELNPKNFMAQVSISLDEVVKVPKDSIAEIAGDGLLGPKYLSISPGNDEENLPSNGIIGRTQSAVSLESLIGKFLFNKDKDDEKKTPAK
ncbi:MAG: outer membrane lipid asymmetry maintenance protein MlaD [Alphaproteobacteria bacterium]|nr:outer membrane lipid asymmetry maintenance protein MlaD [Alphaproteobacteria bacterium]OJV46969.1 MAG: outer membrane lipid asymmetry maintenance protein MlaD [Alphaproteobacteria bacterium 43-37]